jgi:hypothetical protein
MAHQVVAWELKFSIADTPTRAGSSDRLYLGICGSGGGQEWRLTLAEEFTFTKDTNHFYGVGDQAIIGERPWKARKVTSHIDIDDHTQAYLRKDGTNGLKIESANLKLYFDNSGQWYEFNLRIEEPIWLDENYGMQVWMDRKATTQP